MKVVLGPRNCCQVVRSKRKVFRFGITPRPMHRGQRPVSSGRSYLSYIFVTETRTARREWEITQRVAQWIGADHFKQLKEIELLEEFNPRGHHRLRAPCRLFDVEKTRPDGKCLRLIFDAPGEPAHCAAA